MCHSIERIKSILFKPHPIISCSTLITDTENFTYVTLVLSPL
ncbi:hypothetical protein E2C01_074164 [Portunus trituberculatus]|uniref:Uncharacterized protein n=1 Tax=Portunus trituberculatus TaxID=210409 RepID=A0A5B7ICM0_PORTR|nr:hypothetical protein [Portunus trituberculatus]